MLQIRSTKRFTSLSAGSQLSSFDGLGIEFSGIREYAEGDDARLIEWKSSARKEKVHLKVFEATTALRITLIGVNQRSLYFGYNETTRKIYILEKCIDSIYECARAFGHHISTYTDDPTGGVRKHTSQNIISLKHEQKLSFLTVPGDPPHVNSYLQILGKHKTRNEMIIIITDTLEPLDSRNLSILAHMNDVVLIHLVDTFELHPKKDIILGNDDNSGYLPLSHIDIYLEEFEKAREQVKNSILPFGGYVSLTTEDRIIEKLNTFFLTRK